MSAEANAARAELKQHIFAIIEDVCARMPKEGMPTDSWINARVVGVMVWVDKFSEDLRRAQVEKCIHALPASQKSDGYYNEDRDGWNRAIEASVQALCALVKPDIPSPAAQPVKGEI